ncbi:LLM class flavin-dependent oxidoreductase [Rhodopila sp.]|uniref:LLM class flavin-dependent oxidoreductase n=1 Tax=Rhodopila sp. TaxID=2480087 RepID=UPI003D0B6F2B
MKIGLFINTQFPERVDVPAAVPDMIEQVRVSRDAGFKSLWFPHHWLTEPMQMLQIMPAMAFLAAEARGMLIGPNILILPLLNPMHVAEEAATLDVLTGGNYVLGAGLGYREPEFTAFGIPLSERASRFAESVALMRKLWTGGKITHEGKFFTIRDAGLSLRPVRAGGPPIYVAGLVDSAVRRAARIGDAWLIANASSIQEITPQMHTYRAALTEYGRPPLEFPIARECYVGSSFKTALAECKAALEYKYAAYAVWGMTSPLEGIAFEDFARDRFIIGDVESVKDEVLRYKELLGVDHFIMRCQWPGLDQEKTLGSIRRLGKIFAELA